MSPENTIDTQIEFIARHRDSDKISQSLDSHLFGVSEKTKVLASKIGLDIPGELIGLLHDFGKYSQEFQNYIKSAKNIINSHEEDFVDAKSSKGKIDHSTAGSQYIWNTLRNRGPVYEMVGQILALCIASHHSGLIDCLKPNNKNNFEDRMNKDYTKTHLLEAKKNASKSILMRANELLNTPLLIESLRKTIFKIFSHDSINNKVPPEENQIVQFKLGLLTRFLFSCLLDADRLDTADFESPCSSKIRQYGNYKDWPHLIGLLETHLSSFKTKETIDFKRTEISENCLKAARRSKGIYTLTVPTGGGKTLASLRFALNHANFHKMDRVIYVIPFTSIIDQNARVVRGIFETETDEINSIVLEHHSNLTPEIQNWKTKILSENWDCPIVFTTTVQLLETLFGSGTRGARRLHQLSNTVIIFDEIQTLPIRCMHMFCNAINFLVENCNSTIVLCTATQPLLNEIDQKKGFLRLEKENELMPDVPRLFEELKRVDVLDKTTTVGWSDEEISQLAIDQFNIHKSCLVIVNTKASAKSIYKICKDNLKSEVYHLSTNMCAAHRLEVLDEIKYKLKHNIPLICISTQLIESGVDIDFSAVIRFVAGMDSIAQAAGRCNRNAKSVRGEVYIVNPKPENENLEFLPDIKLGRETTERILREFKKDPTVLGGDLLNPKVMERYFKYYFNEREDEMAYRDTTPKRERDDNLLNMLSTNPFNNGKMDSRFHLRHSFASAADVFKVIEQPTQGIIVPYKNGSELINKLLSDGNPNVLRKSLKEAQRYTVSVSQGKLKELQKSNAIHKISEDIEIFYLRDERYYDNDLGLCNESTGTYQSLVL